MNFTKYMRLAVLAAAILGVNSGADALTRVLIAGDRACAGSADSTLVSNLQESHAFMPSSGLFVNPGVNPTGETVYKASVDSNYGAQTIVDGLHSILSKSVNDDIIYSILSVDKPVEEWTVSDLTAAATDADYLVWMHGSLDVKAGTSEEEYYKSLKELLAPFSKSKTVLVQPANSGSVFSSRLLADEFTMPAHGVEQAMNRVAAEIGGVVVPSYDCAFTPDGRIPRAADMVKLGRAIGRAAVSGPVYLGLVESNPFTLVFEANGDKADMNDVNAATMDGAGFEVWRVSGDRPRRLGIESVTVDGKKILLTVRERLAAGDIAVYGGTDMWVGRSNGVRGNLSVDGRPIPVFTAVIGQINAPGDNVKGRITCDGAGVPGVTVSDGYELVTTDIEGYYSMASNKRLGYVFYTLPSGYEPETEANGWQVKIHSQLTSADPGVVESHDFKIKKTDNRKYMLVVGADSHLAARNKDLAQFKDGTIRSMKALKATNPDMKIYSTILGDLAWDQYWYANKYALPEFVATLTEDGYPFPLFAVTGNHDNDGATPAGPECDHEASAAFRRVIAPSYYSYNLGDVHFVVLDDIVYKNTFTEGKSYSAGIVGDRDYGRYYTDAQLEWLRRDLETVVDKSTPVIVCFHIQNWALSTNGSFTVSANLEQSASDNLAQILSEFSDVHMLSGHTHYNFHARPPKYPNIHENNVAGICATWWWTGKLVGRHICKDGSPGGYAVYTVDGRDISWKYRSSEDDSEPQMRIYDMNAVKEAYQTDADIKAWLKYDATQTNYGTIGDNIIYVNVFNYDTDWTVEIFEGDEQLTAKRTTAQDPLHVICYEVPRYKAAKTVTADFVTNKTNHIFSAQATTADRPVTVRVTDSFGNVYTSTIERPGIYSTSM